MSDLQCPATFHVLAPAYEATPDDGTGVARSAIWREVPLAAVYADDGRSAPPDVTGDVPVQALDASRPLWEVLREASDLHRGAHVLVLPGAVTPPLLGPGDAVVVRIDADGVEVRR